MAWLTLVSSGWLQSLNGSGYLFGFYSQSLKRALVLDQRSIDLLAFFNTLGCACGIGPALLYDRIPPAAIVVVGIAHSTAGYSLTWLAIKNPSLFSLWQLSLFQLLIGFAQTYIQTATLVSNARIFPGSRGFVVGYLKGLVGLSASILVQFFLVICDGREECLPLMLSWLLPLLSVVPILAIFRGIPPPRAPNPWNFQFLATTLIVLALFLLASVTVESFIALDRLQIGLGNLALLAILLSPIYVLFRPDHESSKFLPGILELDQEQRELSTEAALLPRVHESGKLGGEFTTLEAIATLDLWLLFAAVLLGAGSSGVIVSNLSQFGHALGYSSHSIAIAVSLLSIASCLGRLTSGIMSEHYLKAYGTPRPLFLALSAVTQALGLILGGIAVPGALFLVSILTGIAEGSLWCLAIATASDLFGLKSFSSTLNIVTVSAPIGELLLSVMLVGSLYDRQGPGLCVGIHCFGSSFVAVAIFCGIGVVGFGALAMRSKSLYGLIGSRNVQRSSR